MATIITRAGKATPLAASEYDENLKMETRLEAAGTAIAADDNRATVVHTGTGDTFTLPDLSTLLAAEDTGDFIVTIKHGGTSGSLTIDPAAANTIDGTEQNLTLAVAEVVTLKGSTSDNWLIVNRSLPDGTEGYVMRMGAINPAWSQTIVQRTADSATTQTSSEFTSIPSWVTEININIAAMSTNGTSVPLIQIGDSAGYETTGHAGSVVTLLAAGVSPGNVAANGFDLAPAWSAASVAQGSYTLKLLDSATNLWVIDGSIGYSNTAAISRTTGYKALSATLDRVRVIMTNSTDVFDGSTTINISYC